MANKKVPVPAQPAPAESPSLGRAVMGAAAVAVLAVAFGYMSGALGDASLGIVLAVVVALAATGRTASALLEHAGTGVARASIVALSLGVVALTAVPVGFAVIPGKPVATGVLTRVGDTMPVPDSVHGPVRLLVRGVLAAAGAATVDFELRGTSSPVHGTLERSVSTQRVGRRGVAQASNERNVEYLDASLEGGGPHRLELARLDGSLTGGLAVRLFADHFPLWMDLVAAVLVLAAVALLAASLQVSTDNVVASGVALAFGAFAQEWLTPDTVVRPLVGALIAGTVVGGAAGGLFASLARRVFPPPARGKAPGGAGRRQPLAS